jgi:hypothetical protein
MWDVLTEAVRIVREALASWPGTLRLLLVMAVIIAGLLLLQPGGAPARPRPDIGAGRVSARASSSLCSSNRLHDWPTGPHAGHGESEMLA